MKRTLTCHTLHDLDAIQNPTFCHMSYALYRMDAEMGRVIATRFPVCSLLQAGDVLQTQLDLSEETLAYLASRDRTLPPLFVMTKAGLGLLCKRYDLAAGIGLFLHIHCPPAAGARLLCTGAFGRESDTTFRLSRRVRMLDEAPRPSDMTVYSALADAWQSVCIGKVGILRPDDRSRLSVSAMREALKSMSGFVGCDIDYRLPDSACNSEREGFCGCPDYFPCYRPMVAEAMLLYVLTEIRTHAAERGAVCIPIRVGKQMSLQFCYSLERGHMTELMCNDLEKTRRYVRDVAECSGLEVHFSAMPLVTSVSSKTPLTVPQTVTMEWPRDPTVLPSGDLKAKLGWR